MPALAARAAEEQASDGAADNGFGLAVSQSGSIKLAGAETARIGSNIQQGGAYIFRNQDAVSGTLPQSAKLTASDGAPGDLFGRAVSLSGNTALISAQNAKVGRNSQQGAAYVFRNLDTAIGAVTQDVKLTAQAADGAANDFFGSAVSLSGSIGLVGDGLAPVAGNSNQGRAYVFRNLDTATGTVNQNVSLIASDGQSEDYFGGAVSESSNMGLVGASGAKVGSKPAQGAAYIYRNLDTVSNTTAQSSKLIASDGAANDHFGSSVSLSGSIGLIGASSAKVSQSGQGAAYVFRNLNVTTGTVSQTAKLYASDGVFGDSFGSAVSESGGTGLIGASQATVGGNAGQGVAYLFRNLDTAQGTLTQNLKLHASDGLANDAFGYAVSLDGDRFIIGAPFATGATASSGKAYSGTISSLTTLDTGNTIGVISGISFVSQESWIVGATTSGNQVTLGRGDTGDVTVANSCVFIGQSAGSNNNMLLVQGTVLANSINVGSGGTTGNKLEIANDANTTAGTVTAKSGITVGSGGTLLLSGSASVTDRLSNSTPVTLASGGSFSTSGLSEGNADAGSTAAFGVLTFGGGATLDFATGANGSTLLSAFGAVSGAGVISILNWSGTAGSDSGAAGNDRLLFATDPAFNTAQLAQFRFYDDSNQPFATGGRELTYHGFTEIVPVPEPGAAAQLLVGAVAAAYFRRQPRHP